MSDKSTKYPLALDDLLALVPREIAACDRQTLEKMIASTSAYDAAVRVRRLRMDDRDVHFNARGFIEACEAEIHALSTMGYAAIERATRMSEYIAALEKARQENE